MKDEEWKNFNLFFILSFHPSAFRLHPSEAFYCLPLFVVDELVFAPLSAEGLTAGASERGAV